MAEPNHTQLRLSLGSYVLGSLEPADRATLDAHLPGCPACREELASYAALPALMSRLSIDQVRQPTPTVPPTVLNRALNTVAAERNSTVTQLHRWRRATVLSAAAATIVAVVLGATLLHTQTPSPPEGTPLIAAAGVSASGSASLQAKPWGTALTLQLQGLPQGDSFTAWVTAPNGTRSIAATWTPSPNGHATLTGAANITDTTHAALQIMQGDTTLLTLPGHQ
jgi:anti-sigma-K factor RskA